MRFLFPWALSFLIFPLALGLVVRRKGIWGRSLTLALLVLAASQPEVALREKREQVVLVVDRSASVGQAGEEAFWELARSVVQRKGELGVVVFAGSPGVVQLPRAALPSSLQVPVDLGPTKTDLGAALDLALALLEGPGQIVLISDGQATQGDTAAAVLRARASGIPIHVVPVGRTDTIRLISLSGPTRVPPGYFELRAQILVERESSSRLVLQVNGEVVETRVRQYAPGLYEELFPLEASEVGVYWLSLEAVDEADPVPENNGLFWAVTVGDPPAILVVSQGQSAIPELLDAARLPYRVLEFLTPKDLVWANLVILDDYPLGQLGPGTVEALRAWVGEGGGLWVVQGRQAAAGYTGPVEELLPVTYAVPQRYQEATAAIVFVLDRSASMAGRAGELTKIDLLKEAAASAAELIPDDDWLGALAFDRSPFWLALPGPATETKPALFEALAGLTPGGGTDLWPAVEWALSALAPVSARIRHIILISDGKTLREGRDFQILYTKVQESGVGLTSIAIGPDADLEILSGLAAAGGGEVYFLPDPRQLPTVLVQETRRALRPRFLEGQYPVISGPAGAEFAEMALPPLLGYTLTFPKPTAEVALLSSLGDPILVFGRLGAGQVAVFNADLAGIWTKGWFASPHLGSFFGQVLSRIWSERAPLEIRWAFEEGSLRILIDVAQEGRWVQGLRFQGILASGTTETTLTFRQTGPGRYEAVVPWPAPGAYLLVVKDEENQYRGSALIPVPYPREYAEFGPKWETLRTITQLTGGKLLEDEEIPELKGEKREWVSLWPFFLWASAGSFLLDLSLRKAIRPKEAKKEKDRLPSV